MTHRYLWQLIFIKYTKDNKRVFYPNFFSNGYFITSEEQMIKYRKYGNMFYIICFAIFIILAKFKIFKILTKAHLLSGQLVLWIFIGIIPLGLIYNLITEKIIFGKNPIIEEKFWVNNGESIRFLCSVTGWIILYISFLYMILYLFLTYCMGLLKVYLWLAVLIGIAIFIVVGKFQILLLQKIDDFTYKLEKDALTVFSQNELEKLEYEKFSPSTNSRMVIENIKRYLPLLINYLAGNESAGYEEITAGLKKFIHEFKDFNVKLYDDGIDEKEHRQIIEENFLPEFSINDKNN